MPIYERKQFVQEVEVEDGQKEARCMEMMIPVEGGESFFIGSVDMILQTPVGRAQNRVVFDVEGDTLEAAFGNWKKAADAAVAKAKDEIQSEVRRAQQAAASRIMTPGQMPGQIPGVAKKLFDEGAQLAGRSRRKRRKR